MSFGGSLNGKSCLDVVSNLFNDTTRIRIQQQNRRPSLANMFSHEAPSLGEGKRTRFISALPRPKEPPPPPPPVTEILRPVVPPRKFHPFTQDEVDKINNVINGSGAASNAGDSSDDVDCFSTDEFSDDEFDSLEPPDYAPPAAPGEDEEEEIDEDDLYDVAEFSEAGKDEEEEAMDMSNTSSSSDPGSTPEESSEEVSSNSSREGECAHSDDGICSNSSSGSNVGQIIEIVSSVNKTSDSSLKNSIQCSSSTLPSNDNSSLNGNGGHSARQQQQQQTRKEDQHQILISSSSWINVQVDPSKFVQKSSSSSSVINVPYMQDCNSDIPEKNNEEEDAAAEASKASGEPVKPPRLKKLARLQKQQQDQLHKTRSEEDMKKISSSFDNLRASSSTRNLYRVRPEISAPVLLATTLNPNDTEAHKSLAQAIPPVTTTSTSGVIPSHRKSLPNASSADGEKLSFKELKRLSSFFPSLSSLSGSSKNSSDSTHNLSNPLNRSSFYVAEAIYEEASSSGSRQASPTSEHIYEEIPDNRKKASSILGLGAHQRPLPPIPQGQNGRKVRQMSGGGGGGSKKRSGSIFEGASKYEILHYLKDAKNRIGHGDFEIDLESDRDDGFDTTGGPPVNGFLGKRNHTHRVSAISTASDSSNCSVDSTGSSTLSSGDGSVLLRGPTERFQVYLYTNIGILTYL